MNRNFVLTGVAVIVLVTLAGCTSTTYTADPIVVDSDTQDELSYENQTSEEFSIDENTDVVGQDVDFQIQSAIELYTSEFDIDGIDGHEEDEFIDEPSSLYATVSTPSPSVLGYSFNPINALGADEIIELLTDNVYDGAVSLDEQVDTETITVEDEEYDAEVYDATVEFGGEEFDNATVVIAEVEYEENYGILLGAYPDDLDEQDNILTLMENSHVDE